jgi:rod shape-determining protein MreD
VRTGIFAVAAFVAVVLDSALAPEIEILGARPDFLVLVIVYGGLALGARTATIAGFLVGLVADSELPEYLGLNALALSVTGFWSAGIWDRLIRGNVLVQAAILFVASLSHDLIYYLVYYRNHMDLLVHFMGRYALLGGVYTAALGVFVYAIGRAKRWEAITDGLRA